MLLANLFGGKWLGGLVLLAVVDGALLGGIAAIISALGSILLGVLAYTKGRSVGRSTEAEAWRLLAEARGHELDQLHDEEH